MKRIKHCRVFVYALTLALCASSLPAHAWWNPFARPKGQIVIVNAPYIELRTGPGRGYPVIYVAERSEQVRVFKSFTDWYKVEAENGVIGYVKNTELNDSLLATGELVEFSKPSKEQFDNRKIEFGMMAGDFSGAQSLTYFSSVHLTPNISTELKYTESFGEFSSIKLYSVNAVHQTWPKWRISPFFSLGAGIMQTFPNSSLVATEDREDSVLSVGGGFFIYASRNFLLRTEYNSHTVLTSREQNEEVHEWKAGFSVFF